MLFDLCGEYNSCSDVIIRLGNLVVAFFLWHFFATAHWKDDSTIRMEPVFAGTSFSLHRCVGGLIPALWRNGRVSARATSNGVGGVGGTGGVGAVRINKPWWAHAAASSIQVDQSLD